MPSLLLSRADALRSVLGALAGAITAGLVGRGSVRADSSQGSSRRNAAENGRIVRCAIHPGIGIGRLGNSPDSFFVGPEVPGVPPSPAGGFKDTDGRIKRQAARFRVYGLDAHGNTVKELTAEDADITWTVHLANKKAAWYQFKLALDIPEAQVASLPTTLQSGRRNPGVSGGKRSRLVIDPGPRSIKGKRTHGPAYRFDSGTFRKRHVPLGELRTDGKGRLLVLGGHGNSGTTQANNAPVHIANNDGWYDDVSDGPVTAYVRIAGKSIPVVPSWVIVGPPDYAPSMTSIVTMYDIAYQAHVDSHRGDVRPVSFTQEIYPILSRFDGLQWVNRGFLEGYGWQGEVPLLDPGMLAQLASASASNATARQQVFARFRDPAYPSLREDAWPRVYGDNFAQPPNSPRQYLTVTREQYRCLQQWAAGDFLADWNPNASPPGTLADLPLNTQPAALDRAALQSCAGGAFHPGEEAPWIMRHPSMYMGFCRLRPRLASDAPEPDYGDTLTPQRAFAADGPLHRSAPGDITRWMAVPWQTDTANCGSAYPGSTVQPSPLPDLPTFWPAVVPNSVLTQSAYTRIMDTGLSSAERQAAFASRLPWARHLSPNYLDRNAQAITAWYQLGFITPAPAPADLALPTRLYVETESAFSDAPPTLTSSNLPLPIERERVL
jgi:hypothetical protein